MPHLRRLLLWLVARTLRRATAGADPTDRLRLAKALLDDSPATARPVTSPGGNRDPRRRVIDRFRALGAVQGQLASYVPDMVLLDTYPARRQLRDAADALKRARTAAALIAGGDLPDRLRSGARASWPLPPEQVLELTEVDELLQLLPAIRRRRRHAELLGPPAVDRPLWTVRYQREHGAFDAVRVDPAAAPATTRKATPGAGPAGEEPAAALGRRLVGIGDVPAAVEDLLRQDSVPAGGPIRVRWLVDEHTGRPGVPRRAATAWDGPELPRDRGEREQVIARSGRPFADMIAAVERLQVVLRPEEVPAHLAAAAGRARAGQPPAPGIVLGDLSRSTECLAEQRHAASAAGWEWVRPRAIVHGGGQAWGDFHDHRPDQMALITTRLLTAPDPGWAVQETFAAEPMQLLRVQGPAGPIYEVGVNGQHRTHLARLLPLPWVFADVQVLPLPWAVEPSWENEEELTELWHGLLQRGLVAGRLATDPVVRLELDWAAASWLLASADTACAINRAYERAYPGAWEALNVPLSVAGDPAAWSAWLAAA